ncbi:HAD family hydrolase [Balneatrix alpica]|uniref:HAD family hydrolase n=1 Tax=Balneatrix alpica TaxID=75684 RepID=A0ABV5Z6G4_9GAMM|nr:HAD family hydrolase [Balneatrix alpica]
MLQFRYWIFDLDGTLIDAPLAFAAIRAELGVPPGEDILSYLDTLPAAESSLRHHRLRAIEMEAAKVSQALKGAKSLLAWLVGQGCQLGILTRNHQEAAWHGLQRCGLAEFFRPEAVLCRERARPKPDPSGIQQLVQSWQAPTEQTLMVGDYLYDLQAGRRAGVSTALINQEPHWQPWWDYYQPGLTELHQRLLKLQAHALKAQPS